MSGARLTNVFRTWTGLTGSRSFISQRDWWAASDGETMGLGLACLALAVTVPVEATLWGVDWEAFGLRRLVGGLPGSAVGGALAGIWLASAWCLDRVLRSRLAEPASPGAGFRLVRALVVGFPGVGLTSIPVWRSRASRNRNPTYQPSPLSERAGAPGWVRSAGLLLPEIRGGVVLALWLGGIAFLLVAATWLAAAERPDLLRRTGLIGGAAALHGLGLLGTVAYTHTLDRRGGARGHYLWAAAWLLPLPLALAAFAPLGFDLGSLRQETLTWTAYARRSQPGRLGRWSELEESLRRTWRTSSWWHRWGRPMATRRKTALSAVDRELLGVCRAKLAMLLGDGVLVGSLLYRGGLDLGSPPWFGCAVLVVVAGVVAGAAASLGRNLLATVRLAPEPSPLGRHRQIWYGAVAVASLGLGLLVGSALAGGQHREAGLLLVYGALCAQLTVAFSFLLRVPLAPWSSDGAGAGIRWCVVLFVLIAAGGFVAALPAAADALLVAAWTMPLWHGLLFLVTRPLFNRVFELADATVGAPRPSEGQALSRVLAVALCPVGGLAVPAWLRLRERLPSCEGCRRSAPHRSSSDL